MASFIVDMAATGLVYGTITGYVWAIVDHHKESGYASPLSNVRDWGNFMNAVQVETHSPKEPRKLFPWKVLTQVLLRTNHKDMEEVAAGLFLLLLLVLL